MKKAFLLLTFLISLCSFAFSDESSGEVEITTITIKNARETNYSKDPDTGNDVIILEGSVELSVEKGGTVSEIKADKITYDRATEMLYADGNVTIDTKGEGAGGETASADSLLLNTSTLEGIFDGGKVVQTKSDALNLPSGSTLIVFSDAFGKGQDNVIAFRNSSLTFCDDDNPHWHIDATRTWLLPGGEFAFFNALLYVGPVPVMYFPAFYYPKDELVFNPVFSIKKREGYSVQTTTYLHGRKGLEASNSSSSEDENDKISSDALYNFMKPTTLKEQRLEGLILHNLDKDFEGDTSEYLKILADWYSNLGFYVGIDGKYRPSQKYITDLSFFLDLGFSNTVFPNNGDFFPFSSSGKTYKDSSAFLGIKVPFRYAANLSLTLSNPFRLSISLPLYSDPFFVSDFKTNRQESMDWISYFLDNDEKKDKENSNNETSSFSWSVNASYSPNLPDFFKPYINSLYISLDSSVNFSSIAARKLAYSDSFLGENEWQNNTPLRKFYYPSLVKPAQFRVDLSGQLFSWPFNKSTETLNNKVPNYPIVLNKPEEFKTAAEIEADMAAKKAEEETENSENTDDKKQNNQKSEDEEKKDEMDFDLYFPELNVQLPGVIETPGLAYSLNYSLNTDFTTQIAYSSSNLNKPEDFNWKNIQSFMYTLRLPFTLSSSLKYSQDFFSMENKVSYNPVFQKHPFISTEVENGGYSVESAESLVLADYKAERQDITSYNSISLKPFIYIDMLKNTKFSWTSNIKLFENTFTGTVKDPLWEQKFIDFKDEKSVTENVISVDLALSEFDNKFSQSFSFSHIMPPLLRQYNFKLNLGFPYVNVSFDTGIYETKKDAAKEDKWKKRPFVQGLSFNMNLLNSPLSFSETYTHNLEENKAESLNLSASWMGFNISYLMSNTYGYDFDSNSGWKIRKDKEFLPSSLSVTYNTPNKTFSTWSDRIHFTPGLSTSVVADLLRPTNSYFIFNPSISFDIKDFLTVKFSATSKNSVLYWYFHNEPGDLYSDWGGFPGNIFKDLFNSFRFDNDALREGSGFKLKSLNLDVEHNLHDWKLYASLKIEPRVIRDNGKPHYDFNPYFTIGVVWKPMDSLKTEIVDEYGEWELK